MYPGAVRPLHVKFLNEPLTSVEGTVFEQRRGGEKVITPWTVEKDDNGNEFYVNPETDETTCERGRELWPAIATRGNF